MQDKQPPTELPSVAPKDNMGVPKATEDNKVPEEVPESSSPTGSAKATQESNQTEKSTQKATSDYNEREANANTQYKLN